MNRSRQKFIGLLMVGTVLVALVGAGVGYRMAASAPGEMTFDGNGRKPLYWYDPMVPSQRFGKPGKSPFMDMQLIPKYAADSSGDASIRIDPKIVQNLGVRLATVERGPFLQPVAAIGNITFNQRNIAVVQARSAGFVSRVYGRAPGDVLAANAPLVDLLVPEWTGAQAEFLALLKNGDRELIEAARQRLTLLGIPTELIARVEARRELCPTVTVRAPLAGVIESLDVREGMTVVAGATLAKITGLVTVWLEAAIPEAQATQIPVGQWVEAHLTAYPGDAFKGRLIAILPEENVETRTLRVRIELANPDGRLRPGMFAQVRLDSGAPVQALSVASEAIIHTGTRTVVIAAGDAGQFTPTEVQTGPEAGGRTVILQGLVEGQKVVASGQFLIDSEASLKGVLARLGGNSPSGSGQ